MRKDIIKRTKKEVADLFEGDIFDFEFSGNDAYTKYQKRENEEFIAEQSKSNFTLFGVPFSIKVREIKNKKTGKKRIEFL